MNEWNSIFTAYSEELRGINWLSSLATASNDPHFAFASDKPAVLDHEFWSNRTHDIESRALSLMTNESIDRIFDDVAAVMDEDLGRFDPIIEYFGRFYPNPVDAGIRRDCETEMAHCVKRDLAWAAIERVIEDLGFFSGLLSWYRLGRWPCGWHGKYPQGHVLCL